MSLPTTYIKRAVLDITLPEALHEKGYEEALSKAMLDELYGFVEEEISKLFPGGERVVIDSLSIDLGALQAVNSEKEFIERFRKIFPEALRRTLPEQSAAGNKVEMLREFFEKGIFPWWASQDAGNDPDAIVQSLQQEELQRLATWLREMIRRQEIRERLAGQLRKETLDLLIYELPEANGNAIRTTISAVLLALRNNGIHWRPGVTNAEQHWLLQEIAKRKPNERIEASEILSALLREISQDTQTAVSTLTNAIISRKEIPSSVTEQAVKQLEKETISSATPEEEAAPGKSVAPVLQALSHFILYGSLPATIFKGDEKSFLLLLEKFSAKHRKQLLFHLRPAFRDPKLLLRLYDQLEENSGKQFFSIFFPEKEKELSAAAELHRNLLHAGLSVSISVPEHVLHVTIATLNLSKAFHLAEGDPVTTLLKPILRVEHTQAESRTFSVLPPAVRRIAEEKVREKKKIEERKRESGKLSSEEPVSPAEQKMQELDEAAAFLNERFLLDLIDFFIREQQLPWWSKPLRKRAHLLPGKFSRENEAALFTAVLQYVLTHYSNSFAAFSKKLISRPATFQQIAWRLSLADLLTFTEAALGREEFSFVAAAQQLLEKARTEKQLQISSAALRDFVVIVLQQVIVEKKSTTFAVFRAFLLQLAEKHSLPPAEIAQLVDLSALPQDQLYPQTKASSAETASSETAQPEIASIPDIRFHPSTVAQFAEQLFSGKIISLPEVHPQELEESILFRINRDAAFRALAETSVWNYSTAVQWLSEHFTVLFARKFIRLVIPQHQTLQVAGKTIELLHGTPTGATSQQLLFLAGRVILRDSVKTAEAFVTAFAKEIAQQFHISETRLQEEMKLAAISGLFREEQHSSIIEKPKKTEQQETINDAAVFSVGEAFSDASGFSMEEFLSGWNQTVTSEQETETETTETISSPETVRKRAESNKNNISFASAETAAENWKTAAIRKLEIFAQAFPVQNEAGRTAINDIRQFILVERAELENRLSSSEKIDQSVFERLLEQSWIQLTTFIEAKLLPAIRNSSTAAKTASKESIRSAAEISTEPGISGEQKLSPEHTFTEKDFPVETYSPSQETSSPAGEISEEQFEKQDSKSLTEQTPGEKENAAEKEYSASSEKKNTVSSEKDAPVEKKNAQATQQPAFTEEETKPENQLSPREKLLRDPVFLVNTLIYFLQHQQLPWWSPYKTTAEMARYATLVIPSNQRLVLHHLGELLTDESLREVIAGKLGETLYEDSSAFDRQLRSTVFIHLLKLLVEKQENVSPSLIRLLETGQQLLLLAEEHFDDERTEQLLLLLLDEMDAQPGEAAEIFLRKKIDPVIWEKLVAQLREELNFPVNAAVSETVAFTEATETKIEAENSLRTEIGAEKENHPDPTSIPQEKKTETVNTNQENSGTAENVSNNISLSDVSQKTNEPSANSSEEHSGLPGVKQEEEEKITSGKNELPEPGDENYPFALDKDAPEQKTEITSSIPSENNSSTSTADHPETELTTKSDSTENSPDEDLREKNEVRQPESSAHSVEKQVEVENETVEQPPIAPASNDPENALNVFSETEKTDAVNAKNQSAALSAEKEKRSLNEKEKSNVTEKYAETAAHLLREQQALIEQLHLLRKKAQSDSNAPRVPPGKMKMLTDSVQPVLQLLDQPAAIVIEKHLPEMIRLIAENSGDISASTAELLQATVTAAAFAENSSPRQLINRLVRQSENAAVIPEALIQLRKNAETAPAPTLLQLTAELIGISENIFPGSVDAVRMKQLLSLSGKLFSTTTTSAPVLITLLAQELAHTAGKPVAEIFSEMKTLLEKRKAEENPPSMVAQYLEAAEAKSAVPEKAQFNPYSGIFTALQQRKEKLQQQAQPVHALLAGQLAKLLATDPAFLPSLEKISEEKRKTPEPKQPAQQEPWMTAKPEAGEPIYVFNSGLVLFWPFLGGLFRRLGYLEGKAFVDAEKQVRAVHLLQYMVDETERAPEHLLPLNKLFCGLPPSAPLDRWITLTEEEKNEAALFTASVKAKWEVLKNTSLENFRKGFVQREGLLYFKDPNWELQVQKGPLDMLLKKLPWGFSTIKFPWNEGILFVKWKI